MVDDQVVIERHARRNYVASSNLPELLYWLLTTSNKSAVNIAWSLDDTVALILRLLDNQHLAKLAKENKTDYKTFNLFNIPGKIFSLKVSLYGQ